MDNDIIDLCSSEEDVPVATAAPADLAAAAEIIQHGIFQRQHAQIRTIVTQQVAQNSHRKKKKKAKNYGWSKKGSKKQRRDARMHANRRKHADDVYARAYLLPTATSVNPHPRPILQTLEDLAMRIVQNSDNDILDPSECKCASCPYSTGCLGLQRYLLLQRCHQINKVLVENPHLYKR